MPRKKSTPHLNDMCLAVASKHALTLTQMNPRNVLQYLNNIPTTFLGQIVAKMVLTLSQNAGQNCRENLDAFKTRFLPRLLASISMVKLTKLDLSGLQRIGKVSEAHAKEFMAGLDEVIPDLVNLTIFVAPSAIVSNNYNSNRAWFDQPSPRDLAAMEKKYKLPAIRDSHLVKLGKHCPKLVRLDVSYNQAVSPRGVLAVAEGCPDLREILLFEIPLNHKELTKAVLTMKKLTFFGCKETGKVLRKIYTESLNNGLEIPKIGLTHVNNLGHKFGRQNMKVRNKRLFVEAVANLAPEVKHVKCMVTDNDVEHLTALKKLESAELVFAKSGNQGPKTALFLNANGDNLTTLTIMCNNFNLAYIQIIGCNCHNLKRFWSRCNNFNSSMISPLKHEFFAKLELLYFRVGEDNLSMFNLGAHVLQYILQNCGPQLQELFIAVRAPNLLTDGYVQSLVEDFGLFNLEKVVIVLPGHNDKEATLLNLSVNTVDYLLQKCPRLRKVENLLTWNVSQEEFAQLSYEAKLMNYDIHFTRRIYRFH